jgi:hypothetical protein
VVHNAKELRSGKILDRLPALLARMRDMLVRRSRLFGQLPGRIKLKAGSRLLVSPFPEIKFIPSCGGVL